MTRNKFRGFGATEENAKKPQRGNPDIIGEGRNPYRAEQGNDCEEKAEKQQTSGYEALDDNESEQKQYMAERMEFLAERTLFDEGLSPEFAAMLCGKTEKETLENIAAFKEQFEKAVEAAVSEKMRGITPKTSSVMAAYDPFLAGLNG